MPRRCYGLYPEICSFPNLWLAFEKAARGKRSHPSVAQFEYNLETELIALQRELREGAYFPGGYRSFTIHEPKRRRISAAPFRDRVVHHALMNVIGPPLERQFIHDSYANQIGKGTHRALERCTRYLRRHRCVLPCDVKQFFPSIDHAILRGILERTIGDAETLTLIDRILAGGIGVLSEEYDMVYFPGDDLFAVQRPRGLPIGNLTSQFWANVYLNELDQFVKRRLNVRAYLRYVDDMLLFADDRRTLRDWRAAVIERLTGLRLTLHENAAQPRPVECGVPFLGFVVFPDHRRLKPRKGHAFRRRFKGMLAAYHAGDLERERLEASLRGWVNHARHGDTWGLRRAMLSSFKVRPHGRWDTTPIPSLQQDGGLRSLAASTHREVSQERALPAGAPDRRRCV